jgi:hypothetical protein
MPFADECRAAFDNASWKMRYKAMTHPRSGPNKVVLYID